MPHRYTPPVGEPGRHETTHTETTPHPQTRPRLRLDMAITPGQNTTRPDMTTETNPPRREPPNPSELAALTPDRTIPADRHLLRLLEGRT
jgi:hypothetical protein